MKPITQLRNWLAQHLRESRSVQAVISMAGATAIGQAAIAASMPLVARLYPPEAFGIYATLAAFIGIVTVASCLCLDQAIVQGSDERSSDALLGAAIRTVPVTATFGGLVLWLLRDRNWLGYGSLPRSAVLLAVVGICLNGVYLAARYRQMRDQRFDVMARATITQGLTRAVAPLAWWTAMPSWYGLALGELTGRSMGVRELLGPRWTTLRCQETFRHWRPWWQVLQREWRHTVLLTISVLVDAGASLLIAPLLSALYGVSVAGEYFLVASLFVAPSALIGTTTADVIHARAATLVRDGSREIHVLLWRVSLKLFVIALAIFLPLAWVAPTVLPWLFGAKWTMLGLFVRAMTPFMIVAFVASPSSRMFVAVGRTDLKAASDVLRFIGTLAVGYYLKVMRIPLSDGVVVLMGFLAFAYLLYLGLAFGAAMSASARSRI